MTPAAFWAQVRAKVARLAWRWADDTAAPVLSLGTGPVLHGWSVRAALQANAPLECG